MPRKSSIKRLPPTLRKEIDKLLADGRHTIDQIVAHLRSLGADVSRSSVGRYSKQFDIVAAKMRESREIAAAFARELGEVPEGDTGQILVEIMRNVVFKLALNANENDDGVDVKDVMRLAKSIKDLSSASKTGVETEAKIREQARKEALEAAAQAVEKSGVQAGLDDNQLGIIRAKILGVEVAV